MPTATCSLCEAVCGLEVELVDGRVTKIQGDIADPASRGLSGVLNLGALAWLVSVGKRGG